MCENLYRKLLFTGSIYYSQNLVLFMQGHLKSLLFLALVENRDKQGLACDLLLNLKSLGEGSNHAN